MDPAAGAALTFAAWAGYLLWVLLMFAAAVTLFVGLPGGWIALGLAVLYDLAHGFHAIGPGPLVLFAGLMVIGEIAEALLGTLYVARRGATRWGVVGTFLGGLAGAIAGGGLLPVAGAILGSFAGAFLGAVLGEYLRDQRLEPSLRVGLHALVGKALASSLKFALALTGAAAAAWAAWPGGS